MGAETAPVSTSGSWPAWMARVAKPGCLFLGMVDEKVSGLRSRVSTPSSRFSALSSRRAPSNPTLKDFLREIAFGGIRNHGRDPLAGTQPSRHFQSRKDVGSATRARQHAFASRQFFHHGKGVDIGDHHNFIADGTIKVWGHEA